MTEEEKNIVSSFAAGLVSYRKLAEEIYEKYKNEETNNPYLIFLENTFGPSQDLNMKEVSRLQIVAIKQKERPDAIF